MALSGASVLIVGGRSGIGLAIARARSVFEEIGSLDHVAVTAGVQATGAVADIETAPVHRAMGARFFGALYACRYAAPRMAAGGSITLCSGVAGTRPQAGRGAGAATTAAVESFVRAGWTLA